MDNNENGRIKSRKEIGAEAEQYVADYLADMGYEILDRNWCMRGGELDIVAKKGELIIFVEVRSWNREYWDNGTPLETVTMAKKRHIIKTALYYIQKHRISLMRTRIRFDVVGLTQTADDYDMEYIENAFNSEGV